MQAARSTTCKRSVARSPVAEEDGARGRAGGQGVSVLDGRDSACVGFMSWKTMKMFGGKSDSLYEA